MKTLFNGFLLICFLGLVLFPAAIVLFSIEKQPYVTQKIPLSLDNIQRVKFIIQKNRPDRIKRKQVKELILSEEDLNLLLGYGLSNGLGIPHALSQVNLTPGFLTAHATLKIPATPLGNYINLSVTAETKNGIPAFHSLKAGRLSLSGSMASPLLAIVHRLLLRLEPYENLSQTRQALKLMTIDGRFLTLTYEWDPHKAKNLKDQMQNSLIQPDHQARLVRHHNELARLLNQVQGKPSSLVDILRPMFAFAGLESEAKGNPVQENKALFQVMALVVTGKKLGSFVNPDLKKKLTQLKPARLLLNQRKDLAQHFLVSAALTVSASSSLANFLGLAKEIDDSNQGSGFSFADLAADKAGVKMGEMAMADPILARQLQQKMEQVFQEAGFMPSISHLPEGIMALEFKVRYEDLDSASYQLINSEIDQRLGKCPLYQN